MLHWGQFLGPRQPWTRRLPSMLSYAHTLGMAYCLQVDYFVSSSFGQAFYDSCKDVVYPVMNQKSMLFVGG